MRPCTVLSFLFPSARALSSSFSSQFIIFLCANLRIELVQLRISNSPSLLVSWKVRPQLEHCFKCALALSHFDYRFIVLAVQLLMAHRGRGTLIWRRPNETKMISVNRDKFMLLPIPFNIFGAADRRDEGHRTHSLLSRQESTDFMLFIVLLGP